MLSDIQAALYRSWYAACPAETGIPARSSFDPLDVPSAMSSLVLAEVQEDDFFFRVVGTDMVDAWGADFTGKRLGEIMTDEYHDFIRGLFDETVAFKRPIFSHSRFQWDRGRHLDTRRLMLPYSRDDNHVAVGYVLVSQVFDYANVGPSTPNIAVDANYDFLEIARKVIGARDVV